MPIEDMDAQSSALYHLIMDAGLADEGQLEEVWEEHERSGTPFRDILFNFEIVEEDQLMWMIAQTLNTEYIDINEMSPSPELIEQFDPEIMRMYQIVPIREDDSFLYVVAADPLNIHLIDELYQVLGRSVEIMVGKPDDIEKALDNYFPPPDPTTAIFMSARWRWPTTRSSSRARVISSAPNQ